LLQYCCGAISYCEAHNWTKQLNMKSNGWFRKNEAKYKLKLNKK